MSLMFLIMALLSLLLPSRAAAASNIYFAQTAQGSANGADCADAYAWNDATHGINAASNNAAGSVLHLCGTFTLSAGQNFYSAPNGGASGNPITIQFESGATLQAPYLGTAFELNGHSHFVIGGLTTCGNGTGGSSCTATIRNTLNGAPGAACSGGPCTTSNSSLFVDASGTTSDVEVKNLYIGPLCYEVSGDNSCVANNQFLVKFYGFSGTLNVHDLYVTDCGWCLNGDGNSVHVWNTESNRTQHFVGMGNASNPAGETDFEFHDNWMHDPGNWTGGANHNNGAHLFYYCPGSTRCTSYQLSGNLIYNNLCTGNWNGNTACIQFEAGVENTYFFNNVCPPNTDSGQYNNGCFQIAGNNNIAYNNTIVGKGSVSTVCVLESGGQKQTVENNVLSSAEALICSNASTTDFNGSGPSWTFYGHNYYMNIQSANGVAFDFITPTMTGKETDSLTTWQGYGNPYLSGFDSTSAYSSSSTVNSTGALQAGSPAIGFGANLSSLCAQNGGSLPNALCFDTSAGNTRAPVARPGPDGGNWDAGAYASAGSSGGSQPNPPVGLTAEVE